MSEDMRRQTLHQVICEVVNDCEETEFIEKRVRAWLKSEFSEKKILELLYDCGMMDTSMKMTITKELSRRINE